MNKVNIEPGMIPAAPDGRLLEKRLGALVAEKTHSVTRSKANPEAVAAHRRTFDLIARYAREDASAIGKDIYYRQDPFDLGVPWMVVANYTSLWNRAHGVTSGNPHVTIFVHSDIEPAQHEDQHTLRIDGDRLIARGASDQKSGIFPGISAVINAPVNLDVAMVVYPNEERGGEAILDLLAGGFTTNVAIQLDGESVPEGKSNISFVKHGKSGARFWVRLPGGEHLPAAHASRPHLVPDAWDDYADPFKAQVRRPVNRGGAGIPRRKERAPVATTVVFNRGKFDGLPGTTNSYVELHGDLRTKDLPTLERDLARIAEVAKSNGLEMLDPYTIMHPYNQDPHDPEAVLYRDIGRTVMEVPMATTIDTGGNDLAKLPDRTVTFLSGLRGGDFHGPNEWVSMQAIQDAAQIQAGFVQHLPHLIRNNNNVYTRYIRCLT